MPSDGRRLARPAFYTGAGADIVGAGPVPVAAAIIEEVESQLHGGLSTARGGADPELVEDLQDPPDVGMSDALGAADPEPEAEPQGPPSLFSPYDAVLSQVELRDEDYVLDEPEYLPIPENAVIPDL